MPLERHVLGANPAGGFLIFSHCVSALQALQLQDERRAEEFARLRGQLIASNAIKAIVAPRRANKTKKFICPLDPKRSQAEQNVTTLNKRRQDF